MAKESNAERVSPITRANYIGNSTGSQENAEYDPLAALANLVGSVEDNVSTSKVASTDSQEFDLESELIQDFQNIDNTGQNNVGEFEENLTSALDVGLREQVTQPPLSETPLVEPHAPEPVEQVVGQPPTFEQIFNTGPTQYSAEPMPAENITQPVGDLSDILSAAPVGDQTATSAMADELLQELDAHQQGLEEKLFAPTVEIVGEPEAADTISAPDVTVPPIERAISDAQIYVAEEASLAAQTVAASDSIEPVTNVAYEPAMMAENPYEPVADVVAAAEFVPDADFAAEFEAAINGNSEEFLHQPTIADGGGYMPAPEADMELSVEAQAPNNVDDNAPFGKLDSSVTMPPVVTPFDHQVDDALHEIIASEVPADNELGWSGNLADELEGIVASSVANTGAAPITNPQAIQNEPEYLSFETAETELYSAEETPVSMSYNAVETAQQEQLSESMPGTTPESMPESMDGYLSFEQELAAELNPEIGDDQFSAAPVAPEIAAQPPQKRSGAAVAAGVLGVAVIVAGGAFGWKYVSGDDVKTSVPTILASTDPVKIKPKNPGGVKVPNQDQIVFEKVNGKSEDKTSQDRLISGAEVPIRVVSADTQPPVVEPLPAAGSIPVVPVAQKSDARVAPNNEPQVRPARAIISPRKVRTVVVRPDGTIVSAKPTATSILPSSKAERIRVASTNKVGNFAQPVEPAVTGTVPKIASPVIGTPAVAPLSPEIITNEDKLGGLARSVKITPISPGNSSTDKLLKINPPAEAPVVKPIVVKPIAVEAPKKLVAQPVEISTPVQAAKPVSRPIRKSANKPVELATASSGDYVMQISSQRSAEAAQASYGRLSRRFAGILGGKGVDIRRFNIKDKGIYYRVRVPVGTRKAAIDLCVRYKAAGGSCFVTR